MRKFGMMLTLMALLVLAAGCGQKPETTVPTGQGNNQAVTKEGSGAATTPQANPSDQDSKNASSTDKNNAGDQKQSQDTTKLKIQSFYTDDQMMELKPVTREIEVPKGHSKYEEAFKALQTADKGMISLWEKAVLNSISYSDSDKQVTIDIKLPNEARLGAGGESLAIDALKKAMFQFDEVKQIELTVDGAKLESLMGHVDLDHPMTRKDK